MVAIKERPEMRNASLDITSHLTAPVANSSANQGSLRALQGRGLKKMALLMGRTNWYDTPPANMTQLFEYNTETKNTPLVGGGNITWAASRVLWTNRLLLIPASNDFSDNQADPDLGRHVVISPTPISGVTDHNGVERASASGILLNDWESLWFLHTRGADSATGNSLRVTSYSSSLAAQLFDNPNAHLLCVRYGDGINSLYFRNGLILPDNSTAYGGGHSKNVQRGKLVVEAADHGPLVVRNTLNTGPGADIGEWNVMRFEDAEGDEQGWVGITREGNFALQAALTGKKYLVHDADNAIMRELFHSGNAEALYAYKVVRTATTGNIALDNTTTAVDGVTVTDGMRILVRLQTTTTQNGIYSASTTGPWERVSDLNESREFYPGLLVLSRQSQRMYRLNIAEGFVLDTTSVSFSDWPPTASTTSHGLVTEIADSSEAKALTNTTHLMPPSRVLDAMNTRSWKRDARVTTTGENLSLTGAATIDGIAVATGDRVLVRHQTNTTQNGIYVANTGGAWSRASDLGLQADFLNGVTVRVVEGTAGVGAGQLYYLSSTTAVTLGTTAIAFSIQPSGAASVADASSTQKGAVLTSVNPVAAASPIVYAVNDPVFDTYIDGCRLTWDSATQFALEPGAVYIPAANKLINVPSRITRAITAPGINTKRHVYLVYNTSTGALTLNDSVDAPVSYSGIAKVRGGTGGPFLNERYVGMVLGNAAGDGIYNFTYEPNDHVRYLTHMETTLTRFVNHSNVPTTVTSTTGAQALIPAHCRMVQILFMSYNGASSANTDVYTMFAIPEFGTVASNNYISRIKSWNFEDNHNSELFPLGSSQTITYVSNRQRSEHNLGMSLQGYIERR